MDPKLKIWETGLICEKCRRKAVALTFVKSGDVWDKHKRTKNLVGKRICHTCVARYLYLNLTLSEKSPTNRWMNRLMFLAIVFFTASLVLLITQIQLLLSAILFFFSVGSIAVWRALESRKPRAPLKIVSPRAPLIYTSDFFESSAGQATTPEE